jgi:hypothetical protein
MSARIDDSKKTWSRPPISSKLFRVWALRRHYGLGIKG